MKYRSIEEKDYEKLLELDKKVYPTDNPVNSDILNNWYSKNSEFGLVFEDDKGNLEGMCITIPLNKKGWENLISGNLAEADLDSNSIFDNSRDKEIGLHIYHIERFSDNKKFYEEALKSLNRVLENLKKENSELKILGVSGYAVTSEGIGLAYNKMNRRERGFISSEHILSKDGKLEILDTESQKELSDKLNEGYEYINRCKMLVLYPNEPSLVWNFLK